MNRLFLEKASRDAGNHILPLFGKIRKAKAKTFKGDLLTSADLLADKVLKQHIRKAYPKDHILSEEGKGRDLDHDRLWILDPLDGTRNFVTGVPTFGVMIAFAKEGRVDCGAVYFPCTNEMFSAERGKGAFLDGKRIHCGNGGLHASYGCVEGVWDAKRHGKVYALQSKPLRVWFNHLVCMAACGCWVASGRRDFLVNTGLWVWDNAPISIILEESGCKVTGFDGKPWTIREPTLVAANPRLHRELIRNLHSK
ncbi:MAG: inositol monophosphatase [Nanoarchaeota archaeon]